MSAASPDPAQPRRLAFAAIAVMTLSHFFHYQGSYDQQVGVAIVGGGGGDHAVPNLDTGFGVANAHETIAGVSGWSIHHHAWMILAALVLLFVFGAQLGKTWRVWGYWIAVAGLLCCLLPIDLSGPPGLGFYMGVLAVALAVWAARANSKSSKQSPVTETPPHA